MINHLRISNFKSIKQVECDLPQFAAIAGRNAAGKTNLLQGLLILKELVGGDSIDPIVKRAVLVPGEILNKDSSENKECLLEVTISAENGTGFILEVRLRLVNGTTPPNFIVSYERLQAIGDNGPSTVYERTEQTTVDKDGKQISFAVDSKKLFVANFTDPQSQQVRDIFQNVKIPDSTTIDSREATSGTTTEENLTNLLLQLRHNEQNTYSEFDKIVRELLPNFSGIKELSSKSETAPINNEEQYLLLFEEKHLRGQLSPKTLSAGDVRTLYFIAIALSTKPFGSLLIEEIENGIHQQRIENIIEHLETIARVRKLQILFTTHSDKVINRLPAHKILYVEKDLTSGTRITALSTPDQMKKINSILEKGGTLMDYIATNFLK